MARTKLIITTSTAGIEGLFQEVLDLALVRVVPTDLVAEIDSLIETNAVVVLGAAVMAADGRLEVPIDPTPQFLDAVDRMRQCPAA